MKKIPTREIALSALACALATVFLTVGVYSEVLLLTGYLLASIALMLPLAKRSYVGYFLSYVATCLLAFLFNAARFWDILPFIVFFGLHPVVNEWQLKSKINRWVACGLKAVWFDLTAYLVWRFVFAMTTTIPFFDQYIIPVIFVLGTAFFVFYDYATYKARAMVNTLVAKIDKNKK